MDRHRNVSLTVTSREQTGQDNKTARRQWPKIPTQVRFSKSSPLGSGDRQSKRKKNERTLIAYAEWKVESGVTRTVRGIPLLTSPPTYQTPTARASLSSSPSLPHLRSVPAILLWTAAYRSARHQRKQSFATLRLHLHPDPAPGPRRWIIPQPADSFVLSAMETKGAGNKHPQFTRRRGADVPRLCSRYDKWTAGGVGWGGGVGWWWWWGSQKSIWMSLATARHDCNTELTSLWLQCDVGC